MALSHAVLFLDGIAVGILADGEAVGAVVAFAPPAVEDAQIEAAVDAGLHAAGAGGLERPAGGVEPHVAAGDHLAGDVHVIVLEKHQVPLQVAVFAQVNDVLDVALAVIVARVGLAGKMNWTGRSGSWASRTMLSNCWKMSGARL